MSITLAQAQQILDGLIQAQINDPVGALESVSISTPTGSRTISYKNSDDLLKQINYWQTFIARLQRAAAGGIRHGRSVANFRGY